MVRNIIFCSLILLLIHRTPGQTLFSDYVNWDAGTNRAIVAVGDAAADGLTSITVYLPNDGTASERGLWYHAGIQDRDNPNVNRGFIWRTNEGGDGQIWATDRSPYATPEAGKVIYRRKALGVIPGNNYFQYETGAFPDVNGVFNPFIMQGIKFVPSNIDPDDGINERLRSTIYWDLDCSVCSSGWTINLFFGYWECSGSISRQTLRVNATFIDPRDFPDYTSNDFCSNESDPRILTFEANGKDFNNITTSKGDFYDDIAERLDLSAHGSGTLNLIQDWTFPVGSIPWRTTQYTTSNTVNIGTVYNPTSLTFNSGTVCQGEVLDLNTLVTPTGGTFLENQFPLQGMISGSDFDASSLSIGSYIVRYRYTNGFGCTSTVDQTIEVVGSPNLSLTTDESICEGESIDLIATGASTYSWSPPSGLDVTTGSRVTATPNATTTYTVVGTSTDGCTSSESVTVTVNDPADVTATTSSTEICKGETIQLDVTGAATGSSYVWSPASRVSNYLIRNPTATLSSDTEFIVTVTDPSGCQSEDLINVFVQTPPVADAGPNIDVCSGVDSFLDGGGSTGVSPLSYLWTGTGIISGADTDSPVINISVDRSFTLTVTDGNGCVDTDVVNVSVDVANANAGLDKTICSGSSIQLSASGGINYSWLPTTGLNDPNASSPIASPTVTTDYTVTVTDGNGCIDTDVVRVNVVDQPTLNVPGTQTICQGESVTLNVSGNSTSYEWSGQGLNVLFGSSVIATPSSTTVYEVTGLLNGCEITKEIIVYVDPLPIVSAGADVEICQGDNVELSGTQNGNYSYLWTGPNIVSGSDTYNPIVSPTISSNYQLLVTDQNGCTNTDIVRVNVNTVSANAGIDKTICLGESVQLSGSGGVSYSWVGDNLNDANISSPVATPITVGNHIYTVTVTSSDGCTDTDEVNVNVLGLPNLVLPDDQTICRGESVILSATGAQSYDWEPFSGLNVSNLASVTASPTSTTVYTVTGTGSNGCTIEDQVVVFVNNPPEADAGTNKQTCRNEDLTLNGSATFGTAPYSYLWSGVGIVSGANTATPTINISSDQTYTLTVTDANGCSDIDRMDVDVNELPNALISVNDFVTTSADICSDEVVQLEAFGGNSYVWSGDPGISNPNIQNPVITVNDTKILTVLVTNSRGCSSETTITLNAVDNPVVNAGGILEICIDDDPYDLRQDVNIQGGIFSGSGIINNFLFAPSNAGIGIHIVDYNVTVGSCSGTSSREIRVKAKPNITTINGQEICPGDSLQLNASGGTSYSWSPLTHVSNPNIANPKVAPLVTTTYTVTGTDVYGCSNTASVLVTVNDLSVNAGINKIICEGESVELNGSSSKTNVTYEWLPDVGLNDNSIPNPIASPSSSTVYSLAVTDVLGCTVTDDVKVTVEAKPDLIVGPKIFICSSETEPVDLRNDINISGGTFTSSSSGLDGVLYYGNREDPGIYFVDYTVQVGNCELTGTREIQVLGDPITSVNGTNFTICKGENIQLSATGGNSYSWFPTNGLSDPDIANPIASPNVTTTYTVEITNVNGCSVSRNIEVEVLSVNAFAGNDVSICEGESIQLSASGGNFYSWSNGNSLNNANVSNPVASPIVTTTYLVTVTSRDGCIDTDEVTVVVEPAPLLDLGGEITLCQDPDESIDVRTFANISGGTWSSESPALDGVIFNPGAEDPGIVFLNYTVNESGCTINGTKEIRILPKPIVTVISDQEICNGESVQLSASGGVSYEWFPKTNINNAFVFNPIVSPSSTTEYTVFVTDFNGCVNSNTVEVSVNTPQTTIIPNTTICQGESIELYATGGGSYLWDNASSLSDSRDNNPIARPNISTTYTVQITNTKGCVTTESVDITVRDSPALDVGNVLILCKNGSEPYDLRQDVSILGGTFTSESNGLQGVQFDPSMVSRPGIYFVDYTIVVDNCTVTATREIQVKGDPVISSDFDQYDICQGDEVQLSVSGGTTYKWFPNIAISNINVNNPIVSPTVDRTYTVTVTNQYGCSSQKEIDVFVSNVEANAGSDVTICEGESVVLRATGGEVYNWYDTTATLSDISINNPIATPIKTTAYGVTVTSREGCIDTDVIKVTVLDKPEIILTSEEISVCENEDVVDLNNYINVVGARWNGPGVSSSGLFDPKVSGPGSFLVEISYENILGCATESSLIIRVPRKPSVYAGPDISVCRSDSIIDISRLATPVGGVFFGAGITNNQFFSPLNSGPGEFEITYTYTNPETGCINSDNRTITVLNSISVFAGPPTSLCIDAEPLDLSLSVSPPGGVFSADSAVNGNFFYPSSGVGEYRVLYSVTDGNNCTSTAERIITVNDRPSLELDSEVISVCENDGIINLNEYPNIPGGTWGGVPGIVNGLLKIDSLGIGSNIVFYDVNTSDGCSLSTELIIEVSPVQSLSLGGTITTCKSGDPVDLLGNFNREVVSVSGPGIIDGTFYPNSVDRGTYEVNYEYENSNGCIARQTRVIVVQGEVFVSTEENISICKNFGNVNLSQYAFPEGGIWQGPYVTLSQFNSVAAPVGDYELVYTVDLGLGCSNSDTLTISVTNSNISNFGLDTIVCVNSPEIHLNFSSELSGGSWSGPGIINNIFYPSEAGQGTWVLSYSNDALECDVAGTRTVRVIDVPPKAIVSSYTISGCVGDIVRITADLLDQNATTQVNYEWYYEGETFPFAVGKNVDFQIRQNENIYFTSVNQFGCQSLVNDFIRIRANGPVGNFSANKDSVAIGELVRFSSNSSNVDEFYWEFGDGNYSELEDPLYYYYSTGWHTVSLTMFSPDDCDYTITREDFIYVYEPIDPADTTTILSVEITEENLIIYPNPNKGEFLLQGPNEMIGGELRIMSLTGKELQNIDLIRTDKINVELNEKVSGTYLLIFTKEGREPVYKKLIVQK
ncbi:MAG: T9SS type A sorting domain-containing protein [Balneola sp.]